LPIFSGGVEFPDSDPLGGFFNGVNLKSISLGILRARCHNHAIQSHAVAATGFSSASGFDQKF